MPVVAIGIGGWVIYARSPHRVRVVPEAFPEQSVPEGKRAGYVAYLPGIVVALIVAGVSYYQTGNYQQVKIWQQATAQAPALLDGRWIRKPIRSTKKRCRVLHWGCVLNCKKIREI